MESNCQCYKTHFWSARKSKPRLWERKAFHSLKKAHSTFTLYEKKEIDVSVTTENYFSKSIKVSIFSLIFDVASVLKKIWKGNGKGNLVLPWNRFALGSQKYPQTFSKRLKTPAFKKCN